MATTFSGGTSSIIVWTDEWTGHYFGTLRPATGNVPSSLASMAL
jgi:hypothetical protein